ncbi:T-cell receptor beta chain V region YT35 [Myotis brandtii]|nr:T-cell receptor beta chain V region YT35 [Myotis brandtii]
MGQSVTLSCEPISGHTHLYWYRQTLERGPKFLIYFNNQIPVDDSGMPKERFSAKMLNGSFSTLNIQPTEPGDSAVYLCASSLATALQSHPLPVQKPSCFPFSIQHHVS